MKKEILITGGAGYIGSHAVKILRQDYKVIVLDNFIYGHRNAIPDPDVIVYEGEISNRPLLDTIFQTHKIEAVMHFAAYTYVGESITDPAKYYANNVAAPLILLDAMREWRCVTFIFSSTCATYGVPEYLPLDEAHPQVPINPYGESKLMLEKIVLDYAKAYGLQYGILRYFNASGAWSDGSIGEDHDPETHLIPLVLKAAKGEIETITVFGTDYDTPDGTCIRDYIHVVDLAQAHLKALERLLTKGQSLVCNLGTGRGTSVKEILNVAEKVTGKKIPVLWSKRREGDSPQLVANASYAKEVLNWEAQCIEIEDIIKSAWHWENGPTQGRFLS